ncbi:MAG: hypothetical protein JNJ76_02710 [Candidatus Competibacter sp.]|nr:hypothetical protein [Candidatus Competibacter sp.]
MKSSENAGVVSAIPRLIPLTDWIHYHPWPPIGGLRHLMFYRESNGFAPAFVKCGRRVLIDEAEFFDCVARNGGGHVKAAA